MILNPSRWVQFNDVRMMEYCWIYLFICFEKFDCRDCFGCVWMYRYLLAIAILSTMYTGLQCLRHVHQLSTGNDFFNLKTSAFVDFVGDQVSFYCQFSIRNESTQLNISAHS